MAEVLVASFCLLRHLKAHFSPVIPMKRISLDVDRLDLLAMKNLLERPFDRGGPRPGRTRDRDDWMPPRHGSLTHPGCERSHDGRIEAHSCACRSRELRRDARRAEPAQSNL